MHLIRIYEIPTCKMVSSGIGMFGEEKFDLFDKWLSAQPRSVFPKDYLFYDKTDAGEGFHWLYLYEDGMTVPDEFDVIDFKGGLYAVATDMDEGTDKNAMNKAIQEFIHANGFEFDTTRPELGNVITPPSVAEVMGYNQMDYYYPIKIKDN